MSWYDPLLEKNIVPDVLLRFAMRRLNAATRRSLEQPSQEVQKERFMAFIEDLKQSDIAINTSAANEQHYECPTEFFTTVLGARRKYSCCYWDEIITNLDQAEEAMLDITAKRARIENGQRILDLGCGWGSMSLYLAQKFPKSRITGVSNSRAQKQFIDTEAKKHNLTNLEIITCDVNKLSLQDTFDRVVSIEMFEHVRNYDRLFGKIHSLLNDDGMLFVHIFCNRRYAYPYTTDDDSWISKHFFTGGIMPSDHLLLYFAKYFETIGHWNVNGLQYKRTCDEWLNKMDDANDRVMHIFKEAYGADNALKHFSYWRIFFMACAELFGMYHGTEWFVSHYLFRKTR